MSVKLIITIFFATLLTACASTERSEQQEKDKIAFAKTFEAMEQQEKAQQEITITSDTFDISVAFKSLPLEQIKKIDTQDRFYFLGVRDKLNISLNIDEPHCAVSDTDNDHFKCIMPKIKSNPHIKVVEQTISTVKRNGGLSLTYVAFVLAGDKKIKTIHSHFLFSKDGKWGDLQASVLQPSHAEFLMMIKFPTHVKLINKK